MSINSPKIIGLCGYPGSGKDEAAKFLIARGWQRIAFADPLRAMALAIDPFVCFSVPREDGGFRTEIRGNGESLKVLGLDPLSEPDNLCNTVTNARLSWLVNGLGWDGAKKLPEVRRLLQRIGTEAVRGIIGPDAWVEIAERSIEVGKRVVFTDVRFANEAEMIRRRGGLICWVQRDSAGDRRHNSHLSEQYPFTMDKAINNNGTLAELENHILEVAGYTL